MLHNLHLLGNEELQHLFIKDSKLLMEGLEKHLNNNILKELRANLKAVIAELDKRRKTDQLKG